MTERSTRPDPDVLLASMRQERERARRGRLKIFFGMCPGVGKTYAMLKDARTQQAAGVEVLLGIVETHGRRETEALLEGLPVVPRARLEYRGTVLEEMDLDAILLWHPKLAIVDELAHTNAPGSRHPKRYQDVLELLDAGIDVHTSLNVQHIESRRDVVQQITGVTMRETVPDSILDHANEVVLIDLTPEHLRERLSAGKVYLGERAAAAAENFFCESNLMALREMSLRIVAEHVDRDLRSAMQQQRITGPWKSGDRLLVAVGASPFSEKLIRYTRRLAGTMEASWIAVNIETPQALDEAGQTRLARNLALARQLGAEVISTSGTDVGEAILRVAADHNVTQIVVGKPQLPAWWKGQRHSPVDWLIRNSGDIDLHMIRSDEAAEKGKTQTWQKMARAPSTEYLQAMGIVGLVTALGLLLLSVLGYWSVALLYLLAVVLSAMQLRRGPILFLAAASALLWNFLFIPPRFTLAIHAPHDWMMFFIYFVVALVTGHLTTRLRDRELAERKAEQRTVALYRLTRAISASASLDQAAAEIVQQIADSLGSPAAVLLRNGNGIGPHAAGTLVLTAKEESVANWSFQRKQSAGRYTETLPDAEALHLPLLSAEQCEGVLALRPQRAPTVEQHDFLNAVASQFASFVQKERALQSVREAQLAEHSQKLQKALFDSISHELKTPLATISGLLDLPAPQFPEIQQAVQRLTRTVNHLLDATRLESGLLRPALEWCDCAELAREAIALSGVGANAVSTILAADLPMIRVDGGLMALAISMLLTNAATHSPPGVPIEIRVAADGASLTYTVIDHGPGLQPGDEEKVFGKFYRGRDARPGGLGLGLSIARQLAELHGGSLRARNGSEGGAVFTLRVPATETMRLPEEQLA